MSDNPNTIPNQPTDAEMRKMWQNKKVRNSKTVNIDPGQKYANVLLLLSPGVTQPDDYVTLGAAINDITGIHDVKLMVDGQTIDTVPEGEKLVVVVDVAIRQQTIPEAE